MSLHHIALWSRDIEALKDFYVNLFEAVPGERYEDERGFCSYFLSFDHGCQIEIMQIPGVLDRATPDHDDIHHVGLHHFAFSAQTESAVRKLTQKARDRGCKIIKEPHATGDGYFEAMLTDPDGNLVEVARAPEAVTPRPSGERSAHSQAETAQ